MCVGPSWFVWSFKMTPLFWNYRAEQSCFSLELGGTVFAAMVLVAHLADLKSRGTMLWEECSIHFWTEQDCNGFLAKGGSIPSASLALLSLVATTFVPGNMSFLENESLHIFRDDWSREGPSWWGTSPKAHSKLYNEIMSSIRAVFTHFSQPEGVPAERLGHAMRILGMNPTQDEDLWSQLGQRSAVSLFVFTRHCLRSFVAALLLLCCLFMNCLCLPFAFSTSAANQVQKHLEGLGSPKYIDQQTFHRFIKDFSYLLIEGRSRVSDWSVLDVAVAFHNTFLSSMIRLNGQSRLPPLGEVQRRAGWIGKVFRESSGRSTDDS